MTLPIKDNNNHPDIAVITRIKQEHPISNGNATNQKNL